MPTKRTIQELYDFFQTGQPDGSITPDRVQDLILTLLGGYGRISGRAGDPIVMADNTWTKVDLTTTLSESSFQFTMPANARLQCTCPIPSTMIVRGFVSIETASASQFEVALGVNGTVDEDSIVDFRIPPGGGAATVPLFTDILQELNDYVEVFIRRVDGNEDPTPAHMYLSGRTVTR